MTTAPWQGLQGHQATLPALCFSKDSQFLGTFQQSSGSTQSSWKSASIGELQVVSPAAVDLSTPGRKTVQPLATDLKLLFKALWKSVPTSKAQSLKIRLTPASPKRTTPFLPAQAARILWRRSRGRNWMLLTGSLSAGKDGCALHMVRGLSMRAAVSSMSASDVAKRLWPLLWGCSQSALGYLSFRASNSNVKFQIDIEPGCIS